MSGYKKTKKNGIPIMLSECSTEPTTLIRRRESDDVELVDCQDDDKNDNKDSTEEDRTIPNMFIKNGPQILELT